MIDRATIERITSTADIVEVVGDYVHLIRRGSNFMGLCPFHNERTPSFSVNKQRNFCYCFSCKKGGSPVNFIMEKEGLNYHEALLHLAKRYGIDVVEREMTDEERERQSIREAMFVANEWAMKLMEKDLHDSDEGRDVGLQYLTHRGVTDTAMKAFHLGYATDNGSHLVSASQKSGFDINILKKVGLVGTSQSGRDYDRFRGRVIFPIQNPSGRVIAFGGRDLKGGLAKYINSPESDLYKKSNELYGIFQAKSSIVSEDKCFLVEGYMDVIGMWQSGMKNVVASSGTALTDGQIAMIHRFTKNITLIYDGDAAGVKASLRGIDMLLSHKLNVKVLLLPDGDDPDSFARKHTPEQFRKYVEEHETDIIRYKALVMLDAMRADPQNRIAAVNSVVTSIAHIPDGVARDVYVQECAALLGIPEETIGKAVAKARFALVEQMKKDRRRKELGYPVDAEPKSDISDNILDKVVAPHQEINTKQSVIPKSQITQYPYYSVEKEVIRLCIRYAFLHFCQYEVETETGETEIVKLDVLQFVKEELEDGNMKFSVPVFGQIFQLLQDMREGYEIYATQRRHEIEKKIILYRAEQIIEIGSRDLSLTAIRKAEKKLESEIEAMRVDGAVEAAKEYPIRILGSHENDEVRSLSLSLSIERHQLSAIFTKDHNTETEEEKLNVLLIRAIDVWKNETLNYRVSEIMKQMNEIAGKGNHDLEIQLQEELKKLMSIRSSMAKHIGDRILFNKR
ncbi:MAG: DNA primase [Muribaculaceae bacterium]|nr:DNA primase [Muribaculaceae bacterium]